MKNLKLLFLLALVTLLMSTTTSCTTIPTGETGFLKTMSDGVNPNDQVYGDGLVMHAPWNDIVTMNTRQQSLGFNDARLKDANQVILTTDFVVGLTLKANKSNDMYVIHGENYIEGFVDDIINSSVKDVFGRYSYVDILGTKRNAVEIEVFDLIKEQFAVDSMLILNYIEIKDVQLPTKIQEQINAKEEQEQINKKAEKKKLEQKYIADARLEKARGDSALVITAAYKAEAIEKISEQLSKSPEYINYIKWKGYADGKGSPWGTNNVFGAESGVFIQK